MNSAHLQIAHSINKSNLEVMDWMENFMNYVEKDNLKLYEKARKYADKLESENKKKEVSPCCKSEFHNDDKSSCCCSPMSEKGGKVKRYSSDGKIPNNDFQKIELPKWLDNIFDKEHINFVNISPNQLEIDFFDKGFIVGNRDIKAVEKKGYTLDSINTFGTSGIMLVFTKNNFAKGAGICFDCHEHAEPSEGYLCQECEDFFENPIKE